MRLFIAEKPSMGRSIAEVLKGPKSSGRGFIETSEGVVSWCVGHVFEDAPPEHYDENWSWQKASVDILPMVPARWIKLPKKDLADQIKVLGDLLRKTDEVVHAGDPDDEGQSIVEEVLEYFGFRGKVSRIWLQALDAVSIRRALDGLRPNAEYEGRGRAAVARGRADWLVGMNLTRAYTYAARASGARVLMPIGRVQTPTLGLVVQRDREIEKFRAVDFFVPAIMVEHPNGTFKAEYVLPEGFDAAGVDPEGRIVDAKLAESIAAACRGRCGSISNYKADRKSEAQPALHSLSTLQQECSRKLALSAKQTLDIAQALYEKYKVTTYPRTDCGFMPEVQHGDAGEILGILSRDTRWGQSATSADASIKSPTWDDKKVTAHHGIAPTRNAADLTALSEVERKVFDIITLRYVQQFYPPHLYISKSVTVEVSAPDGTRHSFRASGRITTDAGWTAVVLPGRPTAKAKDEDDEEDGDEANAVIPDMQRDDGVNVKDASVDRRKTKPPAYFTDASLISAMTGIHRFVQDPEVKKKLREVDGLGTEATRATIIENLVKRELLERRKKQIRSTASGRALIDAVGEQIRDPGTTALWESALNRIREGRITPDQFIEAQVRWLHQRVEEARGATFSSLPTTPRDAKGRPVKPLEGDGKPCPSCKQGVMRTLVARKGPNEGKAFLVCARTECRYIHRDKRTVPPLPDDGKPCPACQAAGRAGVLRTLVASKGPNEGKSFLMCSLQECKHIPRPERPAVAPIEGDGKTCPTCGKGQLRTRVASKGANAGKPFLSCSTWPACPGPNAAERPRVDALPGDGSKCPTCKKGMLRTRVAQSGPNAGKAFLSCNRYPDCKHIGRPDEKVGGGAKGAR